MWYMGSSTQISVIDTTWIFNYLLSRLSFEFCIKPEHNIMDNQKIRNIISLVYSSLIVPLCTQFCSMCPMDSLYVEGLNLCWLPLHSPLVHVSSVCGNKLHGLSAIKVYYYYYRIPRSQVENCVAKFQDLLKKKKVLRNFCIQCMYVFITNEV